MTSFLACHVWTATLLLLCSELMFVTSYMVSRPLEHTHAVSLSAVSARTSRFEQRQALTDNEEKANLPTNLRRRAPGSSANRNDGFLGQFDEIMGLSDKDFLEVSEMPNREAQALRLAYERCEYVTKTFSKTFYMGTSLMRPDAREHVWAIYAWCRRTDDIVDSPRALMNKAVLEGDLLEWDNRLRSIWGQKPKDLFDVAMADTVRAYPTLDIKPFEDMIAGMVMDVPGHALGKMRYANFDELYLYCYRVAGTVGMMTLPILGTAEGVTEEEAKGPATALGIALQLTNILRDVGEDLERGRIYLPQEEMKQFGLTEEDLFACQVTPKWEAFMKFQIQRARDYYTEAATGIPMLAPDARFAVRASLDLYSEILRKIELNGYDNFNSRAYTTKLEKLKILPKSWFECQKITTPKAHRSSVSRNT